MGTAPQSAVPRRIDAYLSSKYWRSLFIPRLHPPGDAKCILQRAQNPLCDQGGRTLCPLSVSEWQNQFPGEFGEQSRFPAVTFRDFVCIQQRGLRDSAQQCRVEHFLPLPASAERQELQDLDETEILILCYCIKFD